MALHARGAGRRRPAGCGPWIALVVLDGGRVRPRPRPCPAGRCRAIDGRATRRAAPAADELWAWAHVHVNRSLLPDGAASSSDDMARGAAAASTPSLAENPDLAYSRLVCPRRAEPRTRPTTRSWCPTFETGRLAGLGLDPAGDARAPRIPAWATTPDRPRGDEPSPTTTAGTSAPARSATSSTSCACCEPRPVDAARRHARHGRAATRARTCPAIADPDLGGVLRLGGALRVPERGADAGGAGRGASATRTGTQPYPHPFQRALAALVEPRRRLRATSPRTTRTPQSGLGRQIEDDPDPLITPPLYGALARADRAAAHRARRRAGRPRRQLGARAQPRPALPRRRRLRHARRAGEPGGVHGRRLGAGRRGPRGQPADPRWRSSRARSSAAWYARHLAPLRRGATRAGRCSLTAPVQRACRAPAASPSPTGSRRSVGARRRRSRRPLRRIAAPGRRGSRARCRSTGRDGSGRRSCTRIDRRARSPPRRRRPAPPGVVDASTRSPTRRRTAGVPPAARRAAAAAARALAPVVLVIAASSLIVLLALGRSAGARGVARRRRDRCLAASSGGCSRTRSAAAPRRSAARGRADRRTASTSCRRSPDFALARPGDDVGRPRRARPTAPRPTRFKAALRDGARLARGAAARRGRAARAARSTSAALARDDRRRRSTPTVTIPRRVLHGHRAARRASPTLRGRAASARRWPTR